MLRSNRDEQQHRLFYSVSMSPTAEPTGHGAGIEQRKLHRLRRFVLRLLSILHIM